jgi:hypothetical protein
MMWELKNVEKWVDENEDHTYNSKVFKTAVECGRNVIPGELGCRCPPVVQFVKIFYKNLI